MCHSEARERGTKNHQPNFLFSPGLLWQTSARLNSEAICSFHAVQTSCNLPPLNQVSHLSLNLLLKLLLPTTARYPTSQPADIQHFVDLLASELHSLYSTWESFFFFFSREKENNKSCFLKNYSRNQTGYKDLGDTKSHINFYFPPPGIRLRVRLLAENYQQCS